MKAVSGIVGLLLFLGIGALLSLPQEKQEPLPVFEPKTIATFPNPIEDMAILSDGRIAVAAGPEVYVLDKTGKQLEVLAFPESVYRITPTEDRSDFFCTVSDHTLWARRQAGFEKIAEFGKYSLATSRALINGDQQVVIAGDGKVQLMTLGTLQYTLLCETDCVIDAVEYDQTNNLVYVGTIGLTTDDRPSVKCVDVATRKVSWEVQTCSISGLHSLAEGVLVSDGMGLRFLKREDGGTIRAKQLATRDTAPDSEGEFVVFDRFLIHRVYESISDLRAKGSIKQIATLRGIGRTAAISDEGLVFTNSSDYSTLDVVDLSPLLEFSTKEP